MQPIAVESHPPLDPQKPTTTPAPPHPKRAKGKNLKAVVEPRQIPPCVVCEEQGHPTQNCHEITIICVHLDTMDTMENLPMVELPSVPIVRNKLLRTNHACTLCGLYGHYSHHFQDFPKFQMDLANLRQHSLESEITLIEEVHPPPPSSDTMSIYMMFSSTGPLVSTTNDGPSDLSLHCFHNDEYILEALTASGYPWDNMHHHSFFLPEYLVS